MSQPPNPPTGGTPAQPPGGWNPDPNPSWSSDPTQQMPAGQQYPPTQPLPAGEQYPATYGQNPGPNAPGAQYPPGQYPAGQSPQNPGQYGQSPAPGQNPPPGQYPAGGQFGQNPGQYGQAPAGGQFGPPGGGYGAPPSGSFGTPTGGSGGGRSKAPLIIGIVAGVVVLGLLAWFLFLRPATTASPTPSSAVPSVPASSPPPSVLVTPSASPSGTPSSGTSASPRPSGSTSASCAAELSANQCDWAVYLRKFVVVSSCLPDSSDSGREAFTCAANPRGKLDGQASVSLRWADDNADLTKLMSDFFERAGVAKSKIGSNWKKSPALTNWWYTDKPKDILGKLGSAAKGSGSGVAWTYKKQLFYVESSSDTDSASTMLDWWAKS